MIVGMTLDLTRWVMLWRMAPELRVVAARGHHQLNTGYLVDLATNGTLEDPALHVVYEQIGRAVDFIREHKGDVPRLGDDMVTMIDNLWGECELLARQNEHDS